jgi:hypothetical protein
MDHNQQGRRPHFHRGRRGSDRRGGERRAPQQPADQGGRPSGEHVDVEQLMRDIRSRIAQRHGIELSTQQIQELASRRLEAILDPRTLNTTLTDQLRRNTAARVDVQLPKIESGYTFDDFTLFETHRGVLRFVRRLLNPILKLFFNPNPLVHALNTQARLNKEAAERETERERRQAEWNALHYEILSRLVTEVARASIETQALSMRAESLAARVDFTDRRVRTIESAAPPQRPPHQRERDVATQPAAPAGEPTTVTTPTPQAPTGESAARRKRRRRRGRRSGGIGPEAPTMAGVSTPAPDFGHADTEEGDEADGDDMPESEAPQTVAEVTPPDPGVTAPTPEQTSQPAPVQPTPPPDEPVPAAPVDHPDPGPPDR